MAWRPEEKPSSPFSLFVLVNNEAHLLPVAAWLHCTELQMQWAHCAIEGKKACIGPFTSDIDAKVIYFIRLCVKPWSAWKPANNCVSCILSFSCSLQPEIMKIPQNSLVESLITFFFPFAAIRWQVSALSKT